jgi:hypothetical protein
VLSKLDATARHDGYFKECLISPILINAARNSASHFGRRPLCRSVTSRRHFSGRPRLSGPQFAPSPVVGSRVPRSRYWEVFRLQVVNDNGPLRAGAPGPLALTLRRTELRRTLLYRKQKIRRYGNWDEPHSGRRWARVLQIGGAPGAFGVIHGQNAVKNAPFQRSRLAIRRLGCRIRYGDTHSDELARQRSRWSFGTLETPRRHLRPALRFSGAGCPSQYLAVPGAALDALALRRPGDADRAGVADGPAGL